MIYYSDSNKVERQVLFVVYGNDVLPRVFLGNNMIIDLALEEPTLVCAPKPKERVTYFPFFGRTPLTQPKTEADVYYPTRLSNKQLGSGTRPDLNSNYGVGFAGELFTEVMFQLTTSQVLSYCGLSKDATLTKTSSNAPMAYQWDVLGEMYLLNREDTRIQLPTVYPIVAYSNESAKFGPANIRNRIINSTIDGKVFAYAVFSQNYYSTSISKTALTKTRDLCDLRVATMALSDINIPTRMSIAGRSINMGGTLTNFLRPAFMLDVNIFPQSDADRTSWMPINLITYEYRSVVPMMHIWRNTTYVTYYVNDLLSYFAGFRFHENGSLFRNRNTKVTKGYSTLAWTPSYLYGNVMLRSLEDYKGKLKSFISDFFRIACFRSCANIEVRKWNPTGTQNLEFSTPRDAYDATPTNDETVANTKILFIQSPDSRQIRQVEGVGTTAEKAQYQIRKRFFERVNQIEMDTTGELNSIFQYLYIKVKRSNGTLKSKYRMKLHHFTGTWGSFERLLTIQLNEGMEYGVFNPCDLNEWTANQGTFTLKLAMGSWPVYIDSDNIQFCSDFWNGNPKLNYEGTSSFFREKAVMTRTINLKIDTVICLRKLDVYSNYAFAPILGYRERNGGGSDWTVTSNVYESDLWLSNTTSIHNVCARDNYNNDIVIYDKGGQYGLDWLTHNGTTDGINKGLYTGTNVGLPFCIKNELSDDVWDEGNILTLSFYP